MPGADLRYLLVAAAFGALVGIGGRFRPADRGPLTWSLLACAAIGAVWLLLDSDASGTMAPALMILVGGASGLVAISLPPRR